MDEQVKANTKLKQEVADLLDKISSKERLIEQLQAKETKELQIDTEAKQMSFKRKIPASVTNRAVKQVYTNLTPFLTDKLIYPENAPNLDVVEASEYESALYVSERIVKQVMNVMD